MQTLWIALGALAGLTAVAMAALAAHALHGLDTARLAMVHNATEMQIWHALALLICGLWAPRGGRLANGAGGAFTLGLLTFCGALYTLGLYAVDLGVVAPIGGMLLLLGWALLGVSAISSRLRA